MTKVLPRRTWSTLATRRLKMSANQLACSGVMLMVLPFRASRSLLIRAICLAVERIGSAAINGHCRFDSYSGRPWWNCGICARSFKVAPQQAERLVRKLVRDNLVAAARVQRKVEGGFGIPHAVDHCCPGCDRHGRVDRGCCAAVIGRCITTPSDLYIHCRA